MIKANYWQFLFIAFVLMVFVAADVASASTIKINPDKTLSINGKKTFPLFVWSPTSTTAGSKNDGFSEISQRYDFGVNSWGYVWGGVTTWRQYQAQYEANNLFYVVPSVVCKGPFPQSSNPIPTCYPTGNNPTTHPFTTADRDAKNFFGYAQMDEPSDSRPLGDYNYLLSVYKSLKAFDPNHPVISVHYTGDKTQAYLLKSQDYADIITEDHYEIRNNLPDSRNLYLYYADRYAAVRVFGSGSVDDYRIPFYTIVQAAGKDVVDSAGSVILANTPDEIRLQTFLAITEGYQGVGYWTYNGYCPACTPVPNMGTWTNPTLWAGMKDLHDEIKAIENILVLKDVARSWHLHYNDAAVTITHPDMAKTISGGYGTFRKINYVLKKDAATNTHYLIVLNKDPASLSGVNIKINGLSGTLTATTLGSKVTGSGRKGRSITVTNGQFTDSFDGRAVHIYQICSGTCSSPNPNPTPTCSDNIQNQGETGIDCGGPCPACSASANQLTLKPGWNQISSTVLSGIDLSSIEQSCTILPYKNQKLWAWNATAQVWTNPTKVEPFKGHWIYAAYQCTVPLSGTATTFTSLQLYNGWNKISASGTFSAIQGTCAGHITGNWIWHWDKATEKWDHPATMQLDKGYWIKVEQNCVLGG